jgi:hypothetical protein
MQQIKYQMMILETGVAWLLILTTDIWDGTKQQDLHFLSTSMSPKESEKMAGTAGGTAHY